jgi:hypothetical protein
MRGRRSSDKAGMLAARHFGARGGIGHLGQRQAAEQGKQDKQKTHYGRR